MRHRKFEKMWILILVAALILAVSYYYGTAVERKEKEPAVYSIVLYQHTDNEWQTLMEGIEQAKKDYRIKIRYMNLAEADTAKEQADIIEREASSGINGIICAAVDSDGLRKELKDRLLHVPMVCVETGTEGFVKIASNDYEMGRELGKKILDDMEEDGESQKKVTVICEYMERESVAQRYNGLSDVFRESGKNIVINPVKRQKGDFNLSLFIGTTFASGAKYVAALDKFATEEAAKAWNACQRLYERNLKEINIYGIGNTAQTVSDLDSGLIKALVYQNEFNMGYEAVKSLVEKEAKGYMTDSSNTMYKLVTRDTLYEPENERLLFPNS